MRKLKILEYCRLGEGSYSLQLLELEFLVLLQLLENGVFYMNQNLGSFKNFFFFNLNYLNKTKLYHYNYF